MKNVALKVAWITTTAPLVVGVSIYMLWLWRPWGFLEIAGILTLLAGSLGVIGAFAGLLVHLNMDSKTPGFKKRPLIQTVTLLAMMGISIFTGLTCFRDVLDRKFVYRITVINNSDDAITDTKIWLNDTAFPSTPILPHQSSTIVYAVKFDGALVFTAKCRGEEIKKEIDSYVPSNMGARVKITIDSQHQVTVTQKKYRTH